MLLFSGNWCAGCSARCLQVGVEPAVLAAESVRIPGVRDSSPRVQVRSSVLGVAPPCKRNSSQNLSIAWLCSLQFGCGYIEARCAQETRWRGASQRHRACRWFVCRCRLPWMCVCVFVCVCVCVSHVYAVFPLSFMTRRARVVCCSGQPGPVLWSPAHHENRGCEGAAVYHEPAQLRTKSVPGHETIRRKVQGTTRVVIEQGSS